LADAVADTGVDPPGPESETEANVDPPGAETSAEEPLELASVGRTCLGPTAGRERTAGTRLRLEHDGAGGKQTVRRAYTDDAHPPHVFALGDSVMLGAARQLLESVDGVGLDAEVGRQFARAAEVLAAREREGRLGQVVVLHLGHNGPIAAAQLEVAIQALGPTRRVVLVNLKVPRAYESANNGLLHAMTRRHPNVTVLDWRAVGLSKKAVFARDGYHLTAAGAHIYARLIAEAVCGAADEPPGKDRTG
jgi:hypothetical protein